MDDADREREREWVKSLVEKFCDDRNSQEEIDNAFTALYDRLGGYILVALDRRFCNSGLDVESIAQKSWLQIRIKRDLFCSNPKDFKGYLRMIAMNFGYEILRNKKEQPLPAQMNFVDPRSNAPEAFDEVSSIDISHLLTDDQKATQQELSIPLKDPDLKNCMEKLRLASPAGFDALVSKTLGKEAEQRVIAIHALSGKQSLYERRSIAKQQVKDCMEKQ